MTKHIFSFLFLLSVITLKAQEVRISGHQTVAKDSVWSLSAGSTVIFDANASVEVLGGLSFQGTAEEPVVITSETASGLGFLINGQSAGDIVLTHVQINELQAPLVFDPFWYRPNVTIANLTFRGNGNGAVVRVAAPFLNLDAPSQVSFKNVNFYNNEGGVSIDGLGQSGWNVAIDGMAFEYNTGASHYQTPLHLDFTGASKNYQITNLLFNQNDGFGLSLSGVDQLVSMGTIYTNPAEVNAILSKASNYRLPDLEATLKPLNESPNWTTKIAGHSHTDQSLSFAAGTDFSQLQLLDSEGNVVPFEAVATEEGYTLSYDEGNAPTLAITSDGTRIPLVESTVTTTTGGGLGFGTGLGAGDGTGGLASIDFSGAANDIFQSIMHPKMKPGFTPSWEMGGMFGGTAYDGRDLKLVRFSTTDFLSILPNVGLFWPGGTLGYTGGVFIQHNTHSHISYRASVNALNVNIGKRLSFPYMATATAGTNATIDSRGNLRNIGHKSSTAVQTLEFEAIRHFKSNQLAEGQKKKWIPAWTAGFGALHYTPYSVNFIPNTTDNPPSALGITYWYLGEGRDVYTNLRRAGTAGQNNIEGMRRYGSFAALASTGFMLTYKRATWQMTGQIKGVLTSTDYLDDFGRGTYYGGDYAGWLDQLFEDTYTDPISGNEMVVSPSWVSRTGSLGGSRAQNYMPDGYWEVKLALSKNIDANPIAPWLAPVRTYTDQALQALHDLQGAPRENTTWEWGTWLGFSAYDGRDLKYAKTLGFVPKPTNLEWTKGMYVQKNTHAKYSWNIGLQTANISYMRTKGMGYLGSGASIPSYNASLDTTVQLDPYLSNFFTKTSSVESNVYYHLLPYGYDAERKWNIVPSIGFGLGIMNYTPKREVTGLDLGDARFFQWAPKSTYYADLRDIGTEGQHILPNGRAYSKWAGTYSAAFQLSMHTQKWIYKVELKSSMTTTDYLDDFGRGAWYGGDYDRWAGNLDVGYFNANLGGEVPLTAAEIAPIPQDANLFTPRATNNMMDGYLQFHIGVARSF